MSDTDPDDSKRRATGTEATNTERSGVQYGLLGPCVDCVLLLGVGVGHYAATLISAITASIARHVFKRGSNNPAFQRDHWLGWTFARRRSSTGVMPACSQNCSIWSMFIMATLVSALMHDAQQFSGAVMQNVLFHA
jgi:hypothetical protein